MNKEVWTSASSWGVTGAAYERFSEHFADALSHCVQRLTLRPNESILDVATGTGWTARILATQWLWTYNNERPHTAIGGIPPRQMLNAA